MLKLYPSLQCSYGRNNQLIIMNKRRLEASIRNIGIAYLLLFFVGGHYAYLNRWGTQIFFWLTLGGLGIWWLIDVFRLANMVYDFNDPIFEELEWIEDQEREREDFLDLRRAEIRKREMYL